MPSHNPRGAAIGRGTELATANRFERVHVEDDWEQLAGDEELGEARRVPTVFFADETRRLIAQNDSPDVFFRYSINPYRGCEHGCAYCYAQPKSAQPENRAVLLISACKLRSNLSYRMFAGLQERPCGVLHER